MLIFALVLKLLVTSMAWLFHSLVQLLRGEPNWHRRSLPNLVDEQSWNINIVYVHLQHTTSRQESKLTGYLGSAPDHRKVGTKTTVDLVEIGLSSIMACPYLRLVMKAAITRRYFGLHFCSFKIIPLIWWCLVKRWWIRIFHIVLLVIWHCHTA